MKTPTVILPIGFDVAADIDAQGEYLGVCGCPVCDESYVLTGQVIRCDKCSFEFPTNAWSNFSSGYNDGMAVSKGAMLTAGMRMKMACDYYRTGFEFAGKHTPDEDGLFCHEVMTKIDWRSIVKVPAYIGLHTLDRCDRCGMKTYRVTEGLCVRCESETSCKHRVSMMEDSCKAGVDLNKFEPGTTPCYFCNLGVPAKCDKFEATPISDILALDQEIKNSISNFVLIGPFVESIKEKHKGEDWSGIVDCPVCGVEKALAVSHSSHNGNVSCQCSTEGCQSWME